jgi:hypothetical protein
VLGSDLLNDKVGTDMIEKEPKSTSGHSCLEAHERLNVIGSQNFTCFVGLTCCGSAFLRGLSKVEDTIPTSDLFPQRTEIPILSILNTQN